MRREKTNGETNKPAKAKYSVFSYLMTLVSVMILIIILSWCVHEKQDVDQLQSPSVMQTENI